MTPTILEMAKREDRRREMQRLLSLRESEGLSLRTLADRSGIPVGTLSWWSHHLRQTEPENVFAEVRVVDLGTDRAACGSVPEVVVRHDDGVTVELGGHAAQQVVDRVLACLERWS